jgi:hypothetical protein
MLDTVSWENAPHTKFSYYLHLRRDGAFKYDKLHRNTFHSVVATSQTYDEALLIGQKVLLAEEPSPPWALKHAVVLLEHAVGARSI